MVTRKVRAVCAASVLCCWGLMAPGASGQITTARCYVDANSTAYQELQDALDDACLPTIWVAAGTYTPTSAGGDPRELTFLPRTGQFISGGFAGNEVSGVFDLSNRDFAANETILSGEIGVPGDRPPI